MWRHSRWESDGSIRKATGDGQFRQAALRESSNRFVQSVHDLLGSHCELKGEIALSRAIYHRSVFQEHLIVNLQVRCESQVMGLALLPTMIRTRQLSPSIGNFRPSPSRSFRSNTPAPRRLFAIATEFCVCGIGIPIPTGGCNPTLPFTGEPNKRHFAMWGSLCHQLLVRFLSHGWFRSVACLSGTTRQSLKDEDRCASNCASREQRIRCSSTFDGKQHLEGWWERYRCSAICSLHV